MIKTLIVALFFMPPIISYGQKKIVKGQFSLWGKAVVNIETEGFFYPKYVIDSICTSKKDSGYSQVYIDSLRENMFGHRFIATGTAIYARYNSKNYLITAKHVLSDPVSISQKIFEHKTMVNHWDTLEAIFPRISIRTPFDYNMISKKLNNLAILNNNFVKGPKPYYFFDVSTGDGIAIVSLQDENYSLLDTLMKRNGYIPISIKDVCDSSNVEPLDEVYSVGYPENVSSVAQVDPSVSAEMQQTNDLVIPFFVKGSVAMYSPHLPYFYADITTHRGSSGSPLIKDGKLVGIVSGVNKYKITDLNGQPTSYNLFAIGHLVSFINTQHLLSYLQKVQIDEDRLSRPAK